MNKTGKIIVSAASVAAALQAVQAINQQDAIISVNSSDDFAEIAHKAVNSAHGQIMVRTNLAAISGSLSLDKQTLDQKYGEFAQATSGDFLSDSVGGSAYGGCYSNCHQACHGSRGWR